MPSSGQCSIGIDQQVDVSRIKSLVAMDEKLCQLASVDQPLKVGLRNLEQGHDLLPLQQMALIGGVHIASIKTASDE